MKNVFAEDAPLTCLRCVHCQMTPETDLSRLFKNHGELKTPDESALVPIYCSKIKRARPAYIWTPCAIADGRIHKSEQTRAAQKVSGDRSLYVTAIERLFLKLHFYDASLNDLRRSTLRTAKGLNKFGRRYGFERAPFRILEAIRQGTAAARAKVPNPRFNDAQREFIRVSFEAGDWPSRGGNCNPVIRSQNEETRARLVDGVAQRGALFSWDSILNHAHEQQPGSQRWRQRWNHENRVTGVFRKADS